ncbi:SDR family oxidoreductase [Cupriavidus basilensis]|uniref:SDR family oxidoreductase n=1 Tax=Cupriavidus basilensis TaxID=68895 RepID=A0ABT6AZK9_9BURK|nr:SDR family oxidoreductase [Cupriavidus basilensis]MDF3837909.1 SDR family oxidoreductase [Cupriavidus basilensis]
MKTAFVTGSTGLLGSNLVALLLSQGYAVKALARDAAKARRQLPADAGDRLSVVVGDVRQRQAYEDALQGVDVVFHAAAHFRDSYKGGRHWPQLYETNVLATGQLLDAAYRQGVRRFVHISSIAVLRGGTGQLLTEDDLQTDVGAVDDYYRSKIEADETVYRFVAAHPDMRACLVLPGWMHGPRDAGPTSAGQFVLDYLQGKLPGVIDAAFSVVDARDVAAVALAASERGVPGRRYLAAGRPLHMRELMAAMEKVSGRAAPTRAVPRWLLFVVAAVQESYARLTGKPVLLSMATVRNIAQDHGRRFSGERIQQEFGLGFRPLEQTLSDELDWLRNHRDQPALA